MFRTSPSFPLGTPRTSPVEGGSHEWYVEVSEYFLSFDSRSHVSLLTEETLRRKAWPLLAGLPNATIITPSPKRHKYQEIPTALSDSVRALLRHDSSRSVLNKYNQQITHDASNDHLGTCPCFHFDNDTWANKSQDLLRVLESVLEKPSRYGSMHYFQGLHDIAGVLLYNLGETGITTAVLQRLCRSHFREALGDDDFVSLLAFLKATVLPLLLMIDPELHDVLACEEVMLPSLVIPWVITWCLHDIADPQVSSRLVDAFLCGHSTFILYFVLALLTRHRADILCCNIEDDDPMMIVLTVKGLSSKIMSDFADIDDGGISAQSLIDDALAYM
jgi:hypothetical protein